MTLRQGAAALAVVGVLVLAGCSNTSDEATKTVVVTETVEKSVPSPKPRPMKRHSAPLSFAAYSGTYYTAEVPAGWVLEEDEVDHSGYIRSLWRDPRSPAASVLIDVVDGETVSAATKAASVMAATSQSAGYEELSSGPTTVADLDGYKWIFRVDGDQRVDYFLNDCRTGIAVLGSAAPGRFPALEATFQRVANSIVASCLSAPEPEPELEPQPETIGRCHPSYEGACLDPNAYDYDCESGSGNGPEYTGPVVVVGPDDYDLDRDGDGSACE